MGEAVASIRYGERAQSKRPNARSFFSLDTTPGAPSLGNVSKSPMNTRPGVVAIA
jgi:hypothetical protein